MAEAQDAATAKLVPAPFATLLAVSGSVALLGLISQIQAHRSELSRLRCVMTPAAQSLVRADELRKQWSCPVYTGWSDLPPPRVAHRDLTAWADVVLIMPATANTIAKLALGIADSLVTTCVLAATTPVVVVPAMNPAMRAKASVERNIEQLKNDGFIIAEGEPVEATLELGPMPPLSDVLMAVGRAIREAPDPSPRLP